MVCSEVGCNEIINDEARCFSRTLWFTESVRCSVLPNNRSARRNRTSMGGFGWQKVVPFSAKAIANRPVPAVYGFRVMSGVGYRLR